VSLIIPTLALTSYPAAAALGGKKSLNKLQPIWVDKKKKQAPLLPFSWLNYDGARLGEFFGSRP
jgi:hypothetical protein